MGDLTGQICVVGQCFAVLQFRCVSQNGCSIGAFGLSHAAAGYTLGQSAAGAELDVALIVLNNTSDGDGITHSDLGRVCCAALQAVAQHASAIDIDVHRDILIFLIVRRIDRGDLTGQICIVTQLLTLAQLSSISQNSLCIGAFGLCNAAAGYTLGQSSAGTKLNLALIVFNNASDGDSITNSDLGNIRITALQAVAQHTLAVDSHVNRDVLIFLIVRRIDLSNLTGQVCIVVQRLTACQLGGIRKDLLCIGAFRLSNTAAADTSDQCTAGAKLQGALVVFNDTLDDDGITLGDLGCFVASQTVADDGCALIALYHHLDSDVVVLTVIGGNDLGDLTGQGCVVIQMLTALQLLGICKNLCRIRRRRLRHTTAADAVDHLTAGIKLDGALVILDDTHNGNNIINRNIDRIITLQTVAQNGLILDSLNRNHNRDVLVVRIVGRIDLNDLTGQGCNIGQGLAIAQCIGCLHDLNRIGGSINGITLLYLIQRTAGIKFNGTVVVLDRAGNSDDVTNLHGFTALALQAVALDRIVLIAFNSHGDSDVLIIRIIHLIDGNNLAGQSHLIGQALPYCQRIGSLNDFAGINCRRQDVIPGPGRGFSVGIGYGSRQLIGSIRITLFVHIDGNSTVAIVNDLDQIFANIHGPYNIKRNIVDTDHRHAFIIDRGFGGFFCVGINGLQVLNGFCCRDHIGVIHLGLLTAGKHTQNHYNQKNPC